MKRLAKPPVFSTLALLLLVAGCGKNPHRLAPVSGNVKMGGQPLAGALVSFLPDTKPGEMPSPTSRGRTDAQGHYTLTTSESLNTSEDKPGAVVGTHRVRISTRKVAAGSESEGGAILARETVPEKYNARTVLTFTVPEEGTDQANFDLPAN